ncbi:cytochrome B562 [Escherichia coli]|nr:cytochrome B562 [Escherichia coli]EFN7021075.1 cytochrome B562 [Escherichia coli]
MDSVHHIWCPLFSQEFQDLPDGAETTLTFLREFSLQDFRGGSPLPAYSVRRERGV